MVVFDVKNTEQKFTIIPRYNLDEVVVTMLNEITREEVNFQTFVTNYEVFMSVPITYDFKDKHSFSITIKGTSNTLLWRGKGIALDI